MSRADENVVVVAFRPSVGMEKKKKKRKKEKGAIKGFKDPNFDS